MADTGSAIRKSAELFQAFRKAYEAKDDIACQDLLAQLKRNFVLLPTYLNPQAQSPTAQQEIVLVREVLEQAVLLSARTKALDDFDGYFSQLKVYYRDIRNDNVPVSTNKMLVVGLNLVRLLVGKRIAEFHSVLEQIPRSDHTNMYIKFPVQLERFLMEGSYNKLLNARNLAPANDYVPIVELLESTVRSEVLECIPKTYTSITMEQAQKLLMLNSLSEAEDATKRQGWQRENGSDTFYFNENAAASKKEISFNEVIQFDIQFAAALQRVV